MSHGPPSKKDVPAAELFLKLSQEKPNDRPFELVDFPRKGEDDEPIGKMAIWPLKEREIIAAKAEATRKTREFIKEKQDQGEHIEGYAQVFNDICSTELLVRCCRDPENRNVPIFPNGAAVRDLLTSDEMSVVVNAYALVQHRLGPIVATMSDVEYEAWVERLGEGGSEIPLASLSWELRTALLMRTARELWTSRMANSSAGLPPAAPSSQPKSAPENLE